MPRMRSGRGAGSRPARRRDDRPVSGSTMRTSTPANGRPQLPCLSAGRSRSSRCAAVRTERLGHPEEVRPGAGGGPASSRGSTASRLPGRSDERSAAGEGGMGREAGGLVGPAAEQRGPLPLEEREGGGRLGLGLGEQGGAGDRAPTGARRRTRPSRRTAWGCRGARPGRCSGPRGRRRWPGARRRACGSRPSARRGCPEVNMIARSSAGRTGASIASTSSAGRGRESASGRRSRRAQVDGSRGVAAAAGRPRRDQAGRGRLEVVEVAAVAVGSARAARSVDAAVRSWARSSGGRSSVLSGTSTAPMRSTPTRPCAHSMPLGIRSPTRSPLHHAGGDEPGGERSRCASSSSA